MRRAQKMNAKEEKLMEELLSKATPAQLRIVRYLGKKQKPEKERKELITGEERDEELKLYKAAILPSYNRKGREREESQLAPTKATSHGRVRCCNKFRGEAHHWAHQKKCHSGAVENEQVSLAKKKGKRQLNLIEELRALELEQVQALLKELLKNDT